MTYKKENTTDNAMDASDDYYQISDDDMDDCEEDSLLEEIDGVPPGLNNTISGVGNGGRGPYERAWTTDATRALIHIRGPMEDRFTEGRQKRTALWLQCTRLLQKRGYRYSSGKVQKKWHNILITYSKNLSKKYQTGYVHWEFFEDMFKYLEGKKADFERQHQQQHHMKKSTRRNELQSGNIKQQQKQQRQQTPTLRSQSRSRSTNDFNGVDHQILLPKVLMDSKSNDDEFDEDSESVVEVLKVPKQEYTDIQEELPLEMNHENVNYDMNASAAEDFLHQKHDNDVTAGHQAEWWREYFERKLSVEQEKVKLQREMHFEQMELKKSALVQQEQLERSKIEAINKLTGAVQQLVGLQSKKM